MSCLVYHDLPVLDDFRHESTRKCAETTRRRKSSRTHPQKAENRPACGYRTVFCSIGIMGMAYFQSASLHLHYTTNGGKVEPFCTNPPKMARNAFYRVELRQKTPANAKKGLPHSAVRQPLFCVGGRFLPQFHPVKGISSHFRRIRAKRLYFSAIGGIMQVQRSTLKICHSHNSYRAENRPVTASRAVFCLLRVRPAAFAPPGRFSAFAGRFVPKIVQNGQIVVH